MCPAIHINSRSWLRSSSTHEPSDPLSEIEISYRSDHSLVGDSSAIRQIFSNCCSRGTSESSTYGKRRICLSNSWSAHFHVSWLSDFIFYQKPLYKSLHQSFVYSLITILSSESGVFLAGMINQQRLKKLFYLKKKQKVD